MATFRIERPQFGQIHIADAETGREVVRIKEEYATLAQDIVDLLTDPRARERHELLPGSPDHRRNVLDAEDGSLLDQGCDAGDDTRTDGRCPAPAVTISHFPDSYGWLPVCEQHRRFPGARWNPSFVPMVADVQQLMTRKGIDQDTAVLRLGGQS
jgi:hypothetical protein